MADSTQRFSDRVENYIRWRPGYPEEVFSILAAEAGLTTPSDIADIGSGTGISAEPFLRRGHRVYGVEPNAEMRGAAERLLTGYERFVSVEGSAESTLLPRASVDCVIAAQAYHWFDQARARDEFRRILRPQGWCILLWNTRRMDSTPFLRAYETLLNELGTDYRQVAHTNIDPARLKEWFAPQTYRYFTVAHAQLFDWEGFKGRVLSSSYAPAAGHAQHDVFMERLEQIYREHQQGGQVSFDYDTEIHLGRL